MLLTFLMAFDACIVLLVSRFLRFEGVYISLVCSIFYKHKNPIANELVVC